MSIVLPRHVTSPYFMLLLKHEVHLDPPFVFLFVVPFYYSSLLTHSILFIVHYFLQLLYALQYFTIPSPSSNHTILSHVVTSVPPRSIILIPSLLKHPVHTLPPSQSSALLFSLCLICAINCVTGWRN